MGNVEAVHHPASLHATKHEQEHTTLQKRTRRSCCCRCTIISISVVLGVALLLGIAAAATWLALKPETPKFAVKSVRPLPSTTTSQAVPAAPQMEVTLSVRNPNRRIGIHYDEVTVVVKKIGKRGGGITIAEGEMKGEGLYQGPRSEEVEMKVDMSMGGEGLQGILALLGNGYNTVTVAPATIHIGSAVRMSVGSWTSGTSRFATDCRASINLVALLQQVGAGASSARNDAGSPPPPPPFTITACSYKLKSFKLYTA